MTPEERKQIISEEFGDMVIQYKNNDVFLNNFQGYLLNIINDKYAVMYFQMTKATKGLLYGYDVLPKVFGLLETTNLDAMGVGKVQSVPTLGLKGEGVLLGFVDTGIDYMSSLFRNEDGTTRIVSIWDQTVENLEASETIYYYGTEYNADMINEAIKSDSPYTIVPSKDEIGHGTMLAGIAGGTPDELSNFSGVVPLSEFVIVKLKQTKNNLRDFLLISHDVTCYSQGDIMLGIQYLVNVGTKLNRPVAICFALGSNMGAHDGNTVLSQFIAFSGNRVGRAFILAAGNEGNSKTHYYGVVDKTLGYKEVELVIGKDEKGFTMELWGFSPSTYSIDMVSPSGQYVTQIIGRLGESREIKFLFENTTVIVDHIVIASLSGDPLIMFRFITPASGIWKLKVYARGGSNLNFHIWLPLTGFITSGTYFNNSNPDTTITTPSNGVLTTTVTAYDAQTKAIYSNASRGYTKDGNIKPDIAAPGVNVLVPLPGPGNKYTRASGTSIAAAHTVGLAAMIFEWGIVRENYLTLGSLQMQRFLIRGVERIPGTTYPNNIWGYGMVNIYNTFLSISGFTN